MRRPCTELLKYLTATDDILLQTKASDAKSAWGGGGKDKGGLLGASSSTSSSPSSSSTSSFSSLSSSSSIASKKKSSSSSVVSQQQQQQHHQRGEAAGECSVAGVGAGKWRRCAHGAGGTEGQCEPAAAPAPVPPTRRNGSGHARPKLERRPSSEEGRPPGPQPAVDAGRLAAARFIRYMHSYSLLPRETGQTGSCGRCRKAGAATQAIECWGRHDRGAAATRHIVVTVKKREEESGHPLLSQLLTSKQRPASYRAHLLLPATTPQPRKSSSSRMSSGVLERDQCPSQAIEVEEKEHRGTVNINPGRWGLRQAKEPDSDPLLAESLGLGSWVSQPDQGLDLGLELGLGWPKVGLVEQAGCFGEEVRDDDDAMGSPMVLSQGLPSPLFPDSRIPDPTPSVTQGQQHLHMQAVCRHPDDQGLLLLGNHRCIPALSLFSPSPALTTFQFDYTLTPMLI